MKLKSPAFNNNEALPPRFTGEGEDVSPPLTWSNVPENCRSFALICEDLDASDSEDFSETFVHWVIYNISAATTYLPEGLPKSEEMDLPVILRQGKNSYNETGYSGPMPPRGSGLHHYVFTLYALDNELSLNGGADRDEVLRWMETHIISEVQLVGTYERRAYQKDRTSPSQWR